MVIIAVFPSRVALMIIIAVFPSGVTLMVIIAVFPSGVAIRDVVDSLVVFVASAFVVHAVVVKPLSETIRAHNWAASVVTVLHLAPFPVHGHVWASECLITRVITGVIVIISVVTEEVVEVLASGVLGVHLHVFPIDNTLVFLGAVVVAVIDLALSEPGELIHAVVV
jgi:hypothetical protein